jgi:CRISPR-associated protein Csb2
VSERRHLLVEVLFHEGLYHGEPEWPPSPARVFQALLAGAARGRELQPEHVSALRTLERAAPPVVGGPIARRCPQHTMYMPNNDLDAEAGNPARVEKIRAKKVYRPRVFDASIPVAYLWAFPDRPPDAAGLESLATDLHQLGRGIDQAWARARWLDDEERSAYEAGYPGRWHRPAEKSEDGERHPVPTSGTTDSLRARFAALENRLRIESQGQSAFWAFRQPPKPVLRTVAYDGSPGRRLFEVVSTEPGAQNGRLCGRPMSDVVTLVEQLRDGARDRLVTAFAGETDKVDTHVVGRSDVPVGRLGRVRIVPLPSIGHPKADPDIRRVLVEVPTGFGSLGVEDIFWSFSGLEIEDAQLVPTTSDGMLGHYGAWRSSRIWETVTAASLPVTRRRIDPEALSAERDKVPLERTEAKRPAEREAEESTARAAVRDALRHAGVDARAVEVVVQREPFLAQGDRAEAFEHLPRFTKHALWHVRVRLDREVRGPLVIGDGRYLGLGLMRPAPRALGCIAFEIRAGLDAQPQGEELGRAFRRAMLSRAGAEWGREAIPAFLSGHDADGRPLSDHRHVRIAVDGGRVVIFPPTGRPIPKGSFHRLSKALAGMTELFAGHLGSLSIRRVELSPSDPLIGSSTTWESTSPYLVCRHEAAADADAAIARDVAGECAREGLPRPEVEVLERWSQQGRGLEGRLRLRFARPVLGPVLLGRNHHLGGGAFVAR